GVQHGETSHATAEIGLDALYRHDDVRIAAVALGNARCGATPFHEDVAAPIDTRGRQDAIEVLLPRQHRLGLAVEMLDGLVLPPDAARQPITAGTRNHLVSGR